MVEVVVVAAVVVGGSGFVVPLVTFVAWIWCEAILTVTFCRSFALASAVVAEASAADAASVVVAVPCVAAPIAAVAVAPCVASNLEQSVNKLCYRGRLKYEVENFQ